MTDLPTGLEHVVRPAGKQAADVDLHGHPEAHLARPALGDLDPAVARDLDRAVEAVHQHPPELAVTPGQTCSKVCRSGAVHRIPADSAPEPPSRSLFSTTSTRAPWRAACAAAAIPATPPPATRRSGPRLPPLVRVLDRRPLHSDPAPLGELLQVCLAAGAAAHPGVPHPAERDVGLVEAVESFTWTIPAVHAFGEGEPSGGEPV